MKSRSLLIISGISTFLFLIIMLLHGAPLKIDDVTPRGIIDLELAGTVSKAVAIYDAWYPDLTTLAIKNTAIDFLFLISYGMFLSISCFRLSQYYDSPVRTMGKWLSVLMIVAAAFDAIENILMFSTLSAHFKKEIVASTLMFASIKFLLVALGIAYIALAGVARLFMPRKNLEHLHDMQNIH